MQLKLAVNRERNCSTKRLWSNTIQVKNIQSTAAKEVSQYLKNAVWVNRKMQKRFLQKNGSYCQQKNAEKVPTEKWLMLSTEKCRKSLTGFLLCSILQKSLVSDTP